MTAILECAQLSGHVYKPQHNHYHGLIIKKVSRVDLTKSSLSGWYHITNVDPNMHAFHHYFAALYLKYHHGKPIDAVIAIRGTVVSLIDNDIQDVMGWWADALSKGEFDRLPWYVHPIWSFVHKCLAITRKFNLPLTLTGHSLGGAIAQVMSLTIQRFPVISFNAPGCGHMPGVEPSRGNMIRNINARYGFINKIGLVLGNIYYVDVPNMEAQAKRIFEQYKDISANQKHHTHDDFWHNSQHTLATYYDAFEALTSNVPASVCQPIRYGNGIQQSLSYLGQAACRDAATAKSKMALLDKVIVAQHAIEHLVETLKTTSYRSLAQTH